MSRCYLCPRLCGVDRAAGEIGFCGARQDIEVARIMVHRWEEPCISGDLGSGAIFLSGCSMQCVYCQNRDISFGRKGRSIAVWELEQEIFGLVEKGVHNLNFVTPTHYTELLLHLIERIKRKVNIPIVWNTSGYECVETINMLDGLVDVYLPDYKYADPTLAKKLSSAENYPDVAIAAIKRMVDQRGAVVVNDDGIMTSGVMVRHLVLPGYRANSMSVLDRLADEIGTDKIYLSLMSQYTPDFYKKSQDSSDKNLRRTLTSFEYGRVSDYAVGLGFNGFFQDRQSADPSFTPEF